MVYPIARWLQAVHDHVGRQSFIGRIPDDCDPLDAGTYPQKVNWNDRDAMRVRAIDCLRVLREEKQDQSRAFQNLE